MQSFANFSCALFAPRAGKPAARFTLAPRILDFSTEPLSTSEDARQEVIECCLPSPTNQYHPNCLLYISQQHDHLCDVRSWVRAWVRLASSSRRHSRAPKISKEQS